MYRNKEYGYITSQSTCTYLPSGESTVNNMFSTQLIPAMTVTLPLNYSTLTHNKVVLQNGESSIVLNINDINTKITQFGLMYPLKNP